ncbi:MAG: hypothetical protein CM15mP8_4080 [Methanobacteriota archaeon]|nr:MAG: hypothetical protein CM15mP8_4080 [Euryarchaeota archaeon]
MIQNLDLINFHLFVALIKRVLPAVMGSGNGKAPSGKGGSGIPGSSGSFVFFSTSFKPEPKGVLSLNIVLSSIRMKVAPKIDD